MKLIFVAFVSFITAILTVESSVRQGFIPDFIGSLTSNLQNTNMNTKSNPTYTCVYSGLWCSCYTNNQGGCSVGCSPNAYHTLYNQTACPRLQNFMLAGFTLSK